MTGSCSVLSWTKTDNGMNLRQKSDCCHCSWSTTRRNKNRFQQSYKVKSRPESRCSELDQTEIDIHAEHLHRSIVTAMLSPHCSEGELAHMFTTSASKVVSTCSLPYCVKYQPMNESDVTALQTEFEACANYWVGDAYTADVGDICCVCWVPFTRKLIVRLAGAL